MFVSKHNTLISLKDRDKHTMKTPFFRSLLGHDSETQMQHYTFQLYLCWPAETWKDNYRRGRWQACQHDGSLWIPFVLQAYSPWVAPDCTSTGGWRAGFVALLHWEIHIYRNSNHSVLYYNTWHVSIIMYMHHIRTIKHDTRANKHREGGRKQQKPLEGSLKRMDGDKNYKAMCKRSHRRALERA